MRRPLRVCLAAACLAVAGAAAAPPAARAGDEGLLLTPELQLKVADAFLAAGEYYRAVTEYRRFLVLFPDSTRTDAALFGAGLASWRGEDYPTGAQFFQLLRARTPGSERTPEAAYLEAASWWRLQRHDRALELLDALPGAFPLSDFALRAQLAAALVAFDEGDPAGARSRLESVAANTSGTPSTTRAREGLLLLDRAGEKTGKSPLLAAGLSFVVPGSGHLYAGRYADGLTAFAINALWITGAVVAARQENWALAALAGGVGLPFYAGNVYGAANAARRWNLGLRAGTRERLAATLDIRF